MSAPKKARTGEPYQLLYHPGIPGRGEYIRLVLEATGTPYTDVAKSVKDGYNQVLSVVDGSKTRSLDANPPVFAPPALQIPSAGKDGKALVIHQTPNIIMYLAEQGVLKPENEADRWHANQLLLTALDVSNEAHDTHHPVAVMLYYEDQKEESLRKSTDFRENRLPKFLSYFERTLKGNEEEGKGKYLVGGKLSYADTTWWQVLDGLHFAFPRELEARREEFPLTFDTFYPVIKEEPGIKEYLSSDRRLQYSMGLFRKYPELDRQ